MSDKIHHYVTPYDASRFVPRLLELGNEFSVSYFQCTPPGDYRTVIIETNVIDLEAMMLEDEDD